MKQHSPRGKVKVHLADCMQFATRSGQIMLYQLTDPGRRICAEARIDPGPLPRESLEHRYWVHHVSGYFEKHGYEISREHPIPGDGAVDLLAERPGEQIAVEIETGKSDIRANLAKVRNASFDRLVIVATSPAAVSACHRAIEKAGLEKDPPVELMTWLDV